MKLLPYAGIALYYAEGGRDMYLTFLTFQGIMYHTIERDKESRHGNGTLGQNTFFHGTLVP